LFVCCSPLTKKKKKMTSSEEGKELAGSLLATPGYQGSLVLNHAGEMLWSDGSLSQEDAELTMRVLFDCRGTLKAMGKGDEALEELVVARGESALRITLTPEHVLVAHGHVGRALVAGGDEEEDEEGEDEEEDGELVGSSKGDDAPAIRAGN
jgi:hypothetical protein